MEQQAAPAALMVRPTRFAVNGATATTNEFQCAENTLDGAELQRRAAEEFDGLARALSAAGVMVCVEEDTAEPLTPDSIFPNNWISTHADGTVVLYPMMADNRRAERRPDLVVGLQDRHGFTVDEVIDFSHHERQGDFLEGTGSLVLDRAARIAYACPSPRTRPELVRRFADRLGYRVVLFRACGPRGLPIYHTNVLLSVGASVAVICAEAIVDHAQRARVLGELRESGHELLIISSEQMTHFAGNMLELRSGRGGRLWVMSRQAEASLGKEQRGLLSREGGLLSAPLETIERCSGGSARCMLAELHLPWRGGS